MFLMEVVRGKVCDSPLESAKGYSLCSLGAGDGAAKGTQGVRASSWKGAVEMTKMRTSLVLWWIRLCASTARGAGVMPRV